MDPRRYPKYFSLVYEAARVENHGELVKLLTQQIPLDCKDHFGLFTPAGQLAGEGRDKAVELLLKLGASNDYVAMAYAAQGKVEDAEKLRKKGGISIKYLAIGAAMFHNNDYAEYLRKKFKLTPEWFVFGAALGKQNHYAAELVALADKEKTDEDDENYIAIELKRIQGLLLSGQHTVAHLICAKHTSSVIQQRISSLICIRQEELAYALIQNKYIMEEKETCPHYFRIPICVCAIQKNIPLLLISCNGWEKTNNFIAQIYSFMNWPPSLTNASLINYVKPQTSWWVMHTTVLYPLS